VECFISSFGSSHKKTTHAHEQKNKKQLNAPYLL